MRRVRVLFVVEAITLAQIVRLRVLAQGLDPARFEVHFASADFDPIVFDEGARFARHAIHSVSKRSVEEALANGRRLYEESTLARYVDEELRLFDEVRPDVVVGDFRWSLAVSAELAGVPCATLINAYWSRHAVRARMPLPDHPIVRWLGVALAEKLFPIAMPRAFAHFAAPLNALRARRGLSPIGGLEDLLTWGDVVLFPDDPVLVPTRGASERHVYLGHVGWSPPTDSSERARARERLDALGSDRPLVYATLGSSGALEVAPAVVDALAGLDVDVLLATAGRFRPRRVPPNVHVVDFAPGELASARARVVVCNGGASTGYQALQQGTPIVGIPSNLDAYLAMTAMEEAGVGVLVRAGTCDAPSLRAAVRRVLDHDGYARAARAARDRFAALDPHARFRDAIEALLARGLRAR